MQARTHSQSTTQQWVTWTTLAALLCQSLLPPTLVQAGSFWPSAQTSVQRLAAQIDRLQQHIDEYGSIVAKDPDVWGQSRLMQHRQEFETQMKLELDEFDKGRINAAESTRDSAFLASALSLQASLDGRTAAPPPAVNAQQQIVVPNSPAATDLNAATSELVPRTNHSGITFRTLKGQGDTPLAIGLEQTIELDQKKRFLDHLNEIRRLNEGDDTADSPGYALHLVRVPVSILPGQRTHEGYGAEITMSIRPQLSDELLPTAFRDFVVNGVRDRITPTVLSIADRANIATLRATLDKQYGWSQTVAATGNTAVQQMQFQDPPEPGFAGGGSDLVGDDSGLRLFGPAFDYSAASALDGVPSMAFEASPIASNVDSNSSPLATTPGGSATPLLVPGVPDTTVVDPDSESRFLSAIKSADSATNASISKNGRISVPTSQSPFIDGITLFRVALDVFDALGRSEVAGKSPQDAPPGRRGLSYPDVEQLLVTELHSAYEWLKQPGAETLWIDHCTPELARAVREFRRGLPESRIEHIVGRGYTDPTAITMEVSQRRKDFFHAVEALFPEAKDSSTSNLAWHILVESALLNEQLVEDMRKLAAEKNAWSVNVDWLPFFGPNPPPEARAAFNQYVQCRWPMHVFALDPVEQDQNIASAFSRRRELQLILALSAANRWIGLNSLTQFVRRLEYDLETIDLNKTAVGFTHGSDTFGWRFVPRVQAPPVASNLEAGIRDLLIGGPDRDRDLLHRRLEPGIRECTALVVMPSFVPYVTLDTKSTWFKLGDEHCNWRRGYLHREGDLRDAVDLSAQIVNLRCLSQQCFGDAHRYRDGEVYRLQRVVETLDRQLPLQTAYVEMPYENELGGFDLFASSTLGLKPTLRGWYGAPGIAVADPTANLRDIGHAVARLRNAVGIIHTELAVELAKPAPDAIRVGALRTQLASVELAANQAILQFNAANEVPPANSTLFLVGKNFSVLGTRVIAGGAEIPDEHVETISRDVLQVTIPSTVSTVLEQGRRFVDVHLATAYGPTSALRIPASDDASPAVTQAEQLLAKAQEELTKSKAEYAKAVAATKAVSPVRFKWKEAELPLAVAYDAGGALMHAGLAAPASQAPEILIEDGVPFRYSAAELAWFLRYKVKGAAAETHVTVQIGQRNVRAGFGPIDTQAFDPDALVQVSGVPLDSQALRMRFDWEQVAATIRANLPHGITPDNKLLEIEYVVVDGYLRFRSTDAHDRALDHTELPVFHVGTLKLPVVVTQAARICPVATYPAMSAPAATPPASQGSASLAAPGR